MGNDGVLLLLRQAPERGEDQGPERRTTTAPSRQAGLSECVCPGSQGCSRRGAPVLPRFMLRSTLRAYRVLGEKGCARKVRRRHGQVHVLPGIHWQSVLLRHERNPQVL